MIGSVLRSVYLDSKKKSSPEENFFDFDSFIRESLSSSREIPIPNMETTYRSSSISKMCEREEAIRFLYQLPKKEKIGYDLQITFDFGHGLHHVAQNKWFGKWGVLFGNWKCFSCGHVVKESTMPKSCEKCKSEDSYQYEEMYFEDKNTFITGHPDGVIISPLTGEKFLLEIKTASSEFFDYLISRLRKPYESHIDQTTIYMNFLKLKYAYILYFDKNRSQFILYRIDYDESRFKALSGKVMLVKKSINNRQIPKRYVCSSSSCTRAKSCVAKKICFELPEEGVEKWLGLKQV